MSEQLKFSTNAKLGKLIGRELITNNTIAIFELIKNAYDAFAETVTIEFIDFDSTGEDLDLEEKKNKVISKLSSKILISDDGKGMSLEEIKKYWMEIGTSNKVDVGTEKKKIKRRYLTRTMNGEKGIGRFGADRIGQELLLTSIGGIGTERSVVRFNWDLFNNVDKDISEFEFKCDVEHFKSSLDTGVCLELSKLRDKWTGKDIIDLKKQLKKMISPFSQEASDFNIYVKFGEYEERIENDSFDNLGVELLVNLQDSGLMQYEISDDYTKHKKVKRIKPPLFGPIKVRMLYINKSAKISFKRKMGISTREYGNIKVFRDNFRILPYGELENDWLGIDNKHSQAVFRTLGTRDILGYVQITKEYNSVLKDATNRQGLNEDILEFKEFKNFIWECLSILEDYIFLQIKEDAEKQGQIIGAKVFDLKENLLTLKKELPIFYDKISLGKNDPKELVEQTISTFKKVENNIIEVEKANQQLSSRLVVMEKIVGTESVLFDLLHAIRNKLAMLDSKISDISRESKNKGISFNLNILSATLKDVSNIVAVALKRASPTRHKKQYIDLSNVIRSFIDEKNFIYDSIDIKFSQNSMGRVKCNPDGFRLLLDNLMSNSVKAMKDLNEKNILICIEDFDNYVRVTFEDNGIGVKKDDAPYIFNVSFSRTNGSGIGLASAYQYMKEENGDISLVEGSTLGGAKFEIKFLKK